MKYSRISVGGGGSMGGRQKTSIFMEKKRELTKEQREKAKGSAKS